MSTRFPADLILAPISRWPTTLPEKSIATVLGTPLEERVTPRQPARPPQASIVIVTHNGLVFTRLCIETLLAAPIETEFEVVVVDNASTDGTPHYLGMLSERDRRVRVRFNRANAGFGAASNLGVDLSRAPIIVLLNNDTVPAGRWLDRLAAHVQAPAAGVIGAVTNRAGNEAEIPVGYRTYGELEQFAEDHARAHRGELLEIRAVVMFCVGLRREVWDRVGPLDERFEIGLFEDDDFAMRVRAAGLRVACADDVFVHHIGQASIGHLAVSGEYSALFHGNRTRWEAKWGIPWRPYAKRMQPGYVQLVERVRRTVCTAVPDGSTVLVVTKGDDQLLQLEGRRAWHFPQADDGTYAGHYPADSAACIAELERLRARGAEFLVIPESSRWWLEYYSEFAQYVQSTYGTLADEMSPAVIVPLGTARGVHVS
jgi:GT2 family glycosyltransferase